MEQNEILFLAYIFESEQSYFCFVFFFHIADLRFTSDFV